jgi:hypothetical protein
MAEKEHKYPKSQSTEMNKVNKNVMGDSTKKTSDNGPHLMQGKGTQFNQAKITKGFLMADNRPGHGQKKNLDKKK